MLVFWDWVSERVALHRKNRMAGMKALLASRAVTHPYLTNHFGSLNHVIPAESID
jgi:hypothetical protein